MLWLKLSKLNSKWIITARPTETARTIIMWKLTPQWSGSWPNRKWNAGNPKNHKKRFFDKRTKGAKYENPLSKSGNPVHL